MSQYGKLLTSILSPDTVRRARPRALPKVGFISALLIVACCDVLANASHADAPIVAEPITARPAYDRFAFAGEPFRVAFATPTVIRFAQLPPDVLDRPILPRAEVAGNVRTSTERAAELPPALLAVSQPVPSETLRPLAAPTGQVSAAPGEPVLLAARPAPMVAGWQRLPEIATQDVPPTSIETGLVPAAPDRRPVLPAAYRFLLERAEADEGAAPGVRSSKTRKANSRARSVERAVPVAATTQPNPPATAGNAWTRRVFGLD